MALVQEYKKTIISVPEYPGILMVEPSKIPIYRFDCEIMQDFDFLKKGEKIKTDVLPIELGNKLILHTGEMASNQIEIKLSEIKNIAISDVQRDFMDKKRLFVKIHLENETKITLCFADYKTSEFVSLVDSFSQVDNTYWKSFEIKFSEGDHFRRTKMYYQTPFLAKGEELLWSYVGIEGVLEKKATFVMALTSFRAIIYYFDTHECECVLLSVPDDILVMNSRKVSQSTEIGIFSPVELRCMRMGSDGTIGTEPSQRIGDVVFMKNGEKILTFGQMTDPHGLACLAITIKKNVIIRDKSIIPSFPLTPDYKNELSNYLDNSDWPNAEQLANFILQKNPDDLIALRAKLGVFLEDQKWEKIVEISEHILNLDPENFDARIQLPEALLNLHEIDKGEKALKESLDLYPDSSQLLSVKRQIDDFRKFNSLVTSKKCNNCSRENTVNSKFCTTCGVKLE